MTTLREISKQETFKRNTRIARMVLEKRIPVKVVALKLHMTPIAIYVALHRWRKEVDQRFGTHAVKKCK